MRLETDDALRCRMRRHLECEEYEAAARVKREQDRRRDRDHRAER